MIRSALFLLAIAFSACDSASEPDVDSGQEDVSITIDRFMGVNAFVDDPIALMDAVGFVREYHNWNWDEGNGRDDYVGYPQNHIKWAPSEVGGGFWNFDSFYAAVNEAGLEIAPCVQGAVDWLQGGTNFPPTHRPVDEPGADPEDPSSYEKKAHFMFQLAARYGATDVADDELTLAPGQPRRSGLGLIRYIEDWNEQNRDWEGPMAHFSPAQYAAMASADYDGHAGTMTGGSGSFGVKNADPEMKLVMGGIAGLDLDYVRGMKAWFDEHRPDGAFAADVINLHHYSWKTSQGWQGGGPARSPEEDDLKGRMQEIVAYRDANLPGVEVWLSEFGWDTHPASPLRAPTIGPFDIQEVQGQWLVRAYLALAAAGVDRAMMYMLRDVNPADPTQFSSSGLVGPKDDWTPKKSWFYVSTMKRVLSGMIFDAEIASDDANVLVYRFRHPENARAVYAVWAGTRENYRMEGFRIQLSEPAESVALLELRPGEAGGVTRPLSISDGAITIDVSERPVFVVAD